MITNLHVKNLALIDEAEINFTPGLNILTGETGAGKSILIGALSLAMGARADKSSIRQGENSGFVELSLTVADDKILKEIDEMGLECEEGEILIRRRISETGSDCHINGQKVTVKELATLCSMLIDICGQRDSLMLLKEKNLREILDSCGGPELTSLLSEIKNLYSEYSDVLCKLGSIETDDSLRKRKADLCEYEIREIDEASLYPGDDEELESLFRKMSNSSKISEALAVVDNIFNDDNGVSSLISRALREISQVSEYDEAIPQMESVLTDIDSLSGDLRHDISNYMETLNFDREEFAHITERLDLINHLKSKYGHTIEDILKYRDEQAKELENLNDHEAYIARLNEQKEDLRSRLISLSKKAHDIRKQAASDLESRLMKELTDMNFLSCVLNVSVEADIDHLTSEGFDTIDFNISLNPGEAPRPLSSIASGGELSRIMLAIKCVTGDADDIETLIFDEIDTGISGKTSLMTGGKLHSISSGRQVICITHQAQVAAQADTHFLISKQVKGDRTYTEVTALDDEGMINELVRMMGTGENSEAARQAAIELKKFRS